MQKAKCAQTHCHQLQSLLIKDLLRQHEPLADHKQRPISRFVHCVDDIDDGDINVLWMTLPPAPLALLELLRCGCSSGCKCKECVNAAAAAPPVTDVYVEEDDLIVLDEM